MTKEFNFLEEIEDTLDKQFPKGKCKERGNALVLYAMFHLKFDEFIKELKEKIKSDVKTEWSDTIMSIIDKLAERKNG